MTRLSLPYLAPLRVTVDLDLVVVVSVEVGSPITADVDAGVYDDAGRLVPADDPRVGAGFELAELLPWPAWTAGDEGMHQ